MSGELQVQENARRFATTRDLWVRQVACGALSDLEDYLATVAWFRRDGDLTRAEALDLSIAALSVPYDALIEWEHMERGAR